MKSLRYIACALGVVAGLVAGASSRVASAQTPITWNGTSGAVWATAGNWVGGTAPANDTTTNSAVFTATTSGSINLNAARSIAGLDIQRDVIFYGSTLTLGIASPTVNTAVNIAAGKTVTFNNTLTRTSGTFNLADGSTLTYGAVAPTGGTYNLTNATININGGVNFAGNPAFYGTGTLNYGFSGTASAFRLNLYDSVNLAIKSTSGGDSGSTTYLRYYGPGSLTLERDFTMLNAPSASISALSGALSLMSSSAAIVTVAGGYTSRFNQLVLLASVNGTVRLDGSTLAIGDGTAGKVQGVFVGAGSGVGTPVSIASRVYTLDATANGGTVRVTGSSTFNNFVTGSVGSNFGAQVALTGSIALYNNGNWQNQNLSSTAVLTGIDVGAAATLGGTGAFNMAAVNGANAKNTLVSGTVAPGDPTISGGIGALTMQTGTLNFSAGSTLAAQVDSSTSLAAGADLLKVIGNLSLVGTVTLSLSDLATTPVALAPNTTFSLINYTGGWNGGLFTAAGSPIADGGQFTAGLNTWRLDYAATTGGSNFSGVQTAGNFVNIVVVPEPGALALAVVGGVVAAWAVRARR